MATPQFEICDSLEEWLHVPTQVLPPCCIPSDVPAGVPKGCLCIKAGSRQPLLAAALQHGHKLTMDQIRDLLHELSVAIPRRGSGANNSVRKRGLVELLVTTVFPDCAAAEHEHMVSALCGPERQSLIPDDTPETTLKMLACLDPNEQQCFKPLIKESLGVLEATAEQARAKERLRIKMQVRDEEKAAQAQKPMEMKAPGVKESNTGARESGPRNRSPPEFNQFLPAVPSLYIHWEPKKQNRVYAEFKNLEGYQRTKAKSFDKAGSFESKVTALVMVFEYISTAYHIKFKDSPDYVASYRPSLGALVSHTVHYT